MNGGAQKTGHRLNAAQADIASLASASARGDGLAAACISVPWFTAVRSFGNGAAGWVGGASPGLRELGGTRSRRAGSDWYSLVLGRSHPARFNSEDGGVEIHSRLLADSRTLSVQSESRVPGRSHDVVGLGRLLRQLARPGCDFSFVAGLALHRHSTGGTWLGCATQRRLPPIRPRSAPLVLASAILNNPRFRDLRKADGSPGGRAAGPWPTSALNFQLQAITDLSLSNDWSSVAASRSMNNGFISVTVPAMGSCKFFRLSLP